MEFPGRHTLDARYPLGFLCQCSGHICVGVLQREKLPGQVFMAYSFGWAGQHCQLCFCFDTAFQAKTKRRVKGIF